MIFFVNVIQTSKKMLYITGQNIYFDKPNISV